MSNAFPVVDYRGYLTNILALTRNNWFDRGWVDSNINIQMNYWSAEMSNLNVTKSLFDYFEVNFYFTLIRIYPDSFVRLHDLVL
jgi:hypothetical protein